MKVLVPIRPGHFIARGGSPAWVCLRLILVL